MSQISSNKLYEHAYKMKWNWKKWLPPDIFHFHNLIFRELNSPVELQMGVLLPFISSCCGPNTRALFLTRPSVLNLFWINVAASGVGKSQSRKRMVSEPLKYILKHSPHDTIDFEVSKYTRAGIEDKIIATKGYCVVITDEGTGFFDDLKKKESKHESDLSLLNQLYDGEGDKTTLAQNRERAVPNNSTAMSISIQQEAFISGLNSMGRTLWLDNGFGERFILTAVQPHKHKYKENKLAVMDMKQKYPEDLIGKICLQILNHHKNKNITYHLDRDATDLYERIFDKYNSQFNMKYSVDDSDIASSQPVLDDEEKSDICVRSKAPEIIGRLTCVMWVYCKAFECVWKGSPFAIPTEITQEYVRRAEEVVNMSYNHSETFSSALFTKQTSLNSSISRPKFSDKAKVINAVIKSSGPLVTVRNLAKNIRNMSTELVRDELEKLHEEGYGWLISKDKMKQDKLVASTKWCSVFLKADIAFLKSDFLKMGSDKDVTDVTYETNYKKRVDENLIDIIKKYHPHKDGMMNTQMYITPEFPGDIPRLHKKVAIRERNALDDLMAEEMAKNELQKDEIKDETKGNLKCNKYADDYEKGEGSKRPLDLTGKIDMDHNLVSSTSSQDEFLVDPTNTTKEVNSKMLQRQYRRTAGGKLVPIRHDDVEHISETDLEGANNRKSKKMYKHRKVDALVINSTDTDTDMDLFPSQTNSSQSGSNEINNICVRKTLRWNRPKIPKKDTKCKENHPVRRSERIISKKKSKEASSSTDVIEPTANKAVRKRRLSKSKRDEMHLAKKKKKNS